MTSSKGLLRFYRPKVDKEPLHRLSSDTRRTSRSYFEAGDALMDGPVMRASKKNGELGKAGMSIRRLTERVCELGQQIVGLPNLRAHDCRHYRATAAIRNGTDIKALQTAGGWNSPAMLLRYAEENVVANEGVVLGKSGEYKGPMGKFATRLTIGKTYGKWYIQQPRCRGGGKRNVVAGVAMPMVAA